MGTIGLAICLAGGVAWGVYHWRSGPGAPAANTAKTVPVAPIAAARPAPANTSPVVGDSFPNPNGSTTDEELLALVRKAVARSPERAIEWARAQGDAVLRRRLLFAVLRAWGESDPVAAVDWVVLQDAGERQLDMEAALAGAARQPQLALAIVRQLLANDPQDSLACGPALIVALDNAGEFQTALEFLQGAPADARADMATATFRRWGESRPQDALKALDAITDPALRDTAFRAMADGWSAGDPTALAAYAVTLPAGADREYAAKQAFDNWSLQDPAAMAAWLNTLPPGTGEYDEGVAQMISRSDSANRGTDTALKWVESMNDSALKQDSFVRVLAEWMQTDPAAARQYTLSASWLDEPLRQELLKYLQAVPPPAPANGGD